MSGSSSTRARRPRRSVRRKLAIATWRPSTDGRIYTRVAVDATALLAYVKQTRAETGARVTITHVVGAAMGRALRASPELRARVVFGRIVQSERCDVGFAVDIDGGTDLAPAVVRAVDRLSPADVARELEAQTSSLRSGADVGHRRTSLLVRLAPWWVLRPVLSGAGLLVSGFGVAAFGQRSFPIGSAFVSNVGSLGLDEAYLAPLPFARVPVYLAVGAVRDAAMVVDGEVVVRPQLVVVATADHRLVDGAHAGQIVRIVRALLADPWQLDT